MWTMHDGTGWGWGAMGMVWMFLFWGSIIALAVWVVSRLTGRSESPDRQTPLDIARSRYASGEISRDEFEQLKRDLS